MATYEVSAPDGGTYRIDGPDGASQAQIQAEVMRQHPTAGTAPAAPPKPQGFLDHALSVLRGVGDVANPLAGLDAGAHAITGAIAAPIAGLAGLASGGNADTVNAVQQGLTYQPRTAGGKLISKGADSLFGLIPQAANAVASAAQEHGIQDPEMAGFADMSDPNTVGTVTPGMAAGINTGIQGAAMMAGGRLAKGLGPADLPPPPIKPDLALVNQTLKDARASGAFVTPEYSESSGGAGGGATGTLASLSGSEVKMQQTLSKYNGRVWAPKVAAKEIGVDGPLTPAAIDKAAEQAGNVYKAVGKVGDFTPDAKLVADMQKVGVRNAAVDKQFGSSTGADVTALQDKYSPKQNPDYQGPQTDIVNATGPPEGAPGMPPAPTLPIKGTLSAAEPRATVIGQGDLFQLQNPPRPSIVQQGELVGAGKGRAPAQGPLGEQQELLGTRQDTSPTNQYQPMNAEAVVQAVRDLRADARSLYKQTENPEALRQADATQRTADALDDFMQRQLRTPAAKGGKGLPNLAEAFTNARTRLAKIASVRDAYNPATGSIDGASLARDLDNGVPLSGGLKTIANTYKAFPKVMQLPERLPTSGGPTVLEQGGAVTALMHGNIPLALSMFARPLARARVNTPGFQNQMVNPPLPGPPGITAGVPQAAPFVGQQPDPSQPPVN